MGNLFAAFISVSILFAQGGDKPAADLGQLRGVTGIEELPPAVIPSPWPYWLALTVVLVAAGAVLAVALTQRRRPGQVAALPPDAWALRELERISALDLPEADAAERLHTLVSDVVRRYLERRFNLHAPRQTTTEFLENMGASPKLTTSQQELLREFLGRCDLAKFARVVLSAGECRETAAMARRFVEETRLSRQPAPSAS